MVKGTLYEEIVNFVVSLSGTTKQSQGGMKAIASVVFMKCRAYMYTRFRPWVKNGRHSSVVTVLFK